MRLHKIFETVADNKNDSSLSSKLRKKRFSIFKSKYNIHAKTQILDVGGTVKFWEDIDINADISLLNINVSSNIKNYNLIQADACDMHMIPDKSFDIAFSNSVIEHVGDFERQKLFAKEIRRVAKAYWVQTPYKHFPIEAHFVFPFFQYFPKRVQLKLGLRWPYSHLKKNNENIPDELSRLRLLNKSEMIRLFPDSEIHKEKFAGLTKSLIAYKVND